MFIVKIFVGILCLCFLFAETLCKVGQSCNTTTTIPEPCPKPERCDDDTQTCVCPETSDVNQDGACVSKAYSDLVDNQGDGSLLAGILIPLCLVAFVICSIYIGRRFELVKWLREKMRQRNRNYDEFIIGQEDDDDPPLA